MKGRIVSDIIEKMKKRLLNPLGLMDLDAAKAEAKATGKRIKGLAEDDSIETAGKGVRVDICPMYGLTIGELVDLCQFIEKTDDPSTHRYQLGSQKIACLRTYIRAGDLGRKIAIPVEEAMILLGEQQGPVEHVILDRAKKEITSQAVPSPSIPLSKPGIEGVTGKHDAEARIPLEKPPVEASGANDEDARKSLEPTESKAQGVNDADARIEVESGGTTKDTVS